MNLDNSKDFASLDRSGMLAEIRGLPEQLSNAWKTAQGLPLPANKKYTRIIIAGMGGSAIGADILSSYIFSKCKLPLYVLRGYQLPAWVQGPEVLVIGSSHSGNTEETLAVFKEALERKCTLMTLSTGGKLFEQARKNKVTAWTFEHAGQPRAAVGYSFGMLLNLFSRLTLIPDQASLLQQAVAEMSALMQEIDADLPAVKNPAKRFAGQAIGRVPVIFGAEHLEPVARRWKTQLNENSKCLAQFEFLPEADHNTLAGLINPEEMLYKTYAIFLTSSLYNERNQKRMELTAREFMLSGVCMDKVACKGESRLSEIWNTILLGDFISFYAAMAYDADPTPIEALSNLKRDLIG